LIKATGFDFNKCSQLSEISGGLLSLLRGEIVLMLRYYWDYLWKDWDYLRRDGIACGEIEITCRENWITCGDPMGGTMQPGMRPAPCGRLAFVFTYTPSQVNLLSRICKNKRAGVT